MRGEQVVSVAREATAARLTLAIFAGVLVVGLGVLTYSETTKTKSQSEQAAEWIAYYGDNARHVSADSHMLHLAVNQLAMTGPTAASLTDARAAADNVAHDLAALPAKFAHPLGSGAIGTAVADLGPAGSALNTAAAGLKAAYVAPASPDQISAAVVTYRNAAGRWNGDLGAIWRAAGQGYPPAVEDPAL